MSNVVVIGAGLGGLPTAYELRHHLPSEHSVTLISAEPQFTFIPGLIRVALNLNSLDRIQIDLATVTQKHGLKWISDRVTGLNPHKKEITLASQETLNYDYLAIATGASFAFDAIPGLGPHGGYTHSVCNPEHTLTARAAWLKFLKNPGPLIAGAMPGAGCFGPAYEFLLLADWELRRLGLRNQVPITYITPEPYPGHLGLGGVYRARELTEKLLKERGIKVIDNAAITNIEPETVTLADGQQIPFKYAMILPSFRGAKFIQETPELGNEKGFIPILPTQQHRQFPSIYALGVSVALSQPEKTLIPIGLPKSGQMTEAMGAAVAHNIAVALGAINNHSQVPTLEALCFAEFGDTGIAYIAAPVLPDPVTGKRRYSYAVQGAWVNLVKAAFEEYFLLKMQWGLGLPWFEKLGLRILFGLSLLKRISQEQDHSIANFKTIL